MSDETKSCSNSSNAEPTATRSHLPMWILVVMLALLYVGGIYFDRHSGWFDKEVYSPYANAAELESYQPRSGAAALLAQGKKNYEFVCGTCHGTDGLGKPGQYPPLAGSEWVNAKGDKRLAEIPLRGLNGPITVKGQPMNFPSGMAAMGAGLSDADLAAVLTYIRSSWGNQGEPATSDDVKAIRAVVAGHPAINGDQELKTIPE
jgi:mono/diheme cytochrome c family protein